MNILSPDTLLTFFSLLVLPVWLLMIFLPNLRLTKIFVESYFIPLFLAAAYLILLLSNASLNNLDFSSVSGIQKLFANPYILLAGWVHYLAFDLFVGAWILSDSKARAIPHVWVIAPLLLTFYFGPVGFLTYYIIRLLKK